MNRDMALGLIVMAVAGLYIRSALAIPVSFLGDAIGAGGVPLVLGWLMALSGAGLFIHALVARRAVAADGSPEDERGGAFADPRHAVIKAAGLILIAAVFLFALRPLGYVPAVALLLAALLAYQGVRLRPLQLLVAIGGALALWALFDLGLGIDLPDGTLLSGLF